MTGLGRDPTAGIERKEGRDLTEEVERKEERDLITGIEKKQRKIQLGAVTQETVLIEAVLMT